MFERHDGEAVDEVEEDEDLERGPGCIVAVRAVGDVVDGGIDGGILLEGGGVVGDEGLLGGEELAV